MELALDRLDLPAPEVLVEELVRVKAAAIGFWVALRCSAMPRRRSALLAKRGIAGGAATRWAAARLPRWYPVLPALALLLFVAAPEGDDACSLSPC